MKKKIITDDFERHLLKEFKEYCHQNFLEANFKGLTTFMLDAGLIEDNKIKKYMVKRSVNHLVLNGITKTSAVHQTSNKYDINTRTIWNLIRDK